MLQDINGIFSKYSFNITVLCGAFIKKVCTEATLEKRTCTTAGLLLGVQVFYVKAPLTGLFSEKCPQKALLALWEKRKKACESGIAS